MRTRPADPSVRPPRCRPAVLRLRPTERRPGARGRRPRSIGRSRRPARDPRLGRSRRPSRRSACPPGDLEGDAVQAARERPQGQRLDCPRPFQLQGAADLAIDGHRDLHGLAVFQRTGLDRKVCVRPGRRAKAHVGGREHRTAIGARRRSPRPVPSRDRLPAAGPSARGRRTTAARAPGRRRVAAPPHPRERGRPRRCQGGTGRSAAVASQSAQAAIQTVGSRSEMPDLDTKRSATPYALTWLTKMRA